MTDAPKVAKWPGWEDLDKRFEPYAIQLGWLAYSWNSLHDQLGHLFWVLTGLKNGKIPLAIWNAVKSDRAQRDIVRATAKEALQNNQTVYDEIKWILDRADVFEEHRNNALHTPLTFTIDSDGPQLSSKWLSGHQRAMKLKDKDLLNEFAWYGRSANTLAKYAQRISVHLMDSSQFAMPERPQMPVLGKDQLKNHP
jgi:hypothetical protein